jgi:hypothetical protein
MTAFVCGLQLEPWQAVEPRKASLVFGQLSFFFFAICRHSVDWVVIAIKLFISWHRETLVSYTIHADLFLPST